MRKEESKEGLPTILFAQLPRFTHTSQWPTVSQWGKPLNQTPLAEEQVPTKIGSVCTPDGSYGLTGSRGRKFAESARRWIRSYNL